MSGSQPASYRGSHREDLLACCLLFIVVINRLLMGWTGVETAGRVRAGVVVTSVRLRYYGRRALPRRAFQGTGPHNMFPVLMIITSLSLQSTVYSSVACARAAR